MVLSWFDTHAHVCDPKFDIDREDVIETSFKSGIIGFIEIADGPSEWPKAQALAERHPGKIWWAAGLHPYFADQTSPSLWNDLKKLSKHPQFVAIGEVGLDYAKCPIPPEQQKAAFATALDLAAEIEKPLVIHCRDAYPDLLPILTQRFPKPGLSPGVIHCFSGNQQDAERLIDMGFYLGVDGPLTYPKADVLRAIFAKIPMDRIVIETDSPYLPPQGHRGERNEPSRIGLIGLQLALLRCETPENLSQSLLQNSRTLFRLNPL